MSRTPAADPAADDEAPAPKPSEMRLFLKASPHTIGVDFPRESTKAEVEPGAGGFAGRGGRGQSWICYWAAAFLFATVALAGPDLRLIEAVKNRDAKAAKLLVEQHVDVNAAQPDGATALAWAAFIDVSVGEGEPTAQRISPRNCVKRWESFRRQCE